MIGKLTKCAIAGGIIVFLWGTISWMLPWNQHYLHEFKNEKAVVKVIRANATGSGIYEPSFGLVAVKMEGQSPDMTGSLVKDLILSIVGAFLVTWLLLQCSATTYFRQVGFVTMVGLVIGLLGPLSWWVLYGFPIGMTIVSLAEPTIAWFLSGLVIAKLAK
jgi:hypothetical protein